MKTCCFEFAGLLVGVHDGCMHALRPVVLLLGKHVEPCRNNIDGELYLHSQCGSNHDIFISIYSSSIRGHDKVLEVSDRNAFERFVEDAHNPLHASITHQE